TNPTSTSVCVDPTNPSANVNCVEVYVAVTNQGGPDVGCPVGDWKDPLASPLQFTGFSPQNGTPSDTNFGWTFNGSAAPDTLSKPNVGAYAFLHPTPGRKCWGWSPDGRFFALAYEPMGPSYPGKTWRITVLGLEGATGLNGNPYSTTVYPWPVFDYLTSTT